METSRASRPLVDEWVVKAHLLASMTSLFLVMLLGLVFSSQFVRGYLFKGVELLSPGRIRMLHTNLAAYGFIANALLAGLYWTIPRLTANPVWSQPLSRLLFWIWQLILVATGVGILLGHAQAIEWGETPLFVDPFVVLGLVLVSINFYVPVVRTKEKALYVSLWYFSVAFVWTGLNYLMGNYLPQWFIPGSAGAAISGLFIHDLVGLFVTPIGWGLMYYFVPILLKKPIWSHALSLIGFWALAFFYPLNGVHHFLWSPIPMYVQYGAVASTVAVEIVVTTVIINFFMTLKGSGDALRTNLPIRWFYVGMINYLIVCLQCAFQTTLTAQKAIHFTDWVVGHAHLVMFGVFGFWILGLVTHLWPTLVGKAWHSERLNAWAFWLNTLGIHAMFITLVAAGLVQGFLWMSLAPWEDSLVWSLPFWVFRIFAGLAMFAGLGLFLYNLWRTATAEVGEEIPKAVPVTAGGGGH